MDYSKFDNSIVVCSSSFKNHLLEQNLLLNIKIMSMNELIKKLTFDYDDHAILKVMEKENIKYSLAQMYLDNIYYIENKEYNNEKLDKLVEIKNYVYDELIFDNLFKKYVKNKKIYIINHNLNKYEKKVLSNLNYEVIDTRCNVYNHDVFLFEYMEDEVRFIGNKICELIENGVDINKIKLYNVSNDYYKIIKREFGFLNLKVNYSMNRPLISTFAGKYISNHLDDIESSITYIKEKYDNKIVNKIIGVLNKCVWSNYNKDLVLEGLRNTSISEDVYDKGIDVIDVLDVLDDDYVFLMGFNEGVIPKTYKDEDYINDSIKMDYLENTLEKNIISRSETLKDIKSVKNLIISSKKRDNNQTYYVSSLINSIKEIDIPYNKSYSTLYDKIEYTRALDNYNKYGVISSNLGILSNSYNILYNKYDHRYKKISNFKLPKKLKLSYTSFEKYNECGFKYYIDNVLKINAFENTFSSFMGTLVHSILENNLKNNIDVDVIIDDFINNNELSNKELFFCNKVRDEVKKIIKVINYQKNEGDLDKALYEQNIVVNNDKYDLVGKIDKIMYKEVDDNIYACLVDYKTGSADISLKYMDYGLGMQLPIYAYLINYSKLKNIILAGFYLQKIILKTPKRSKKTLDEMLTDSLKLEGFSNKDKDIVRLIDENFEKSNVIKSMSVKNDGEFNLNAKVLSNDEIRELIEYTKNKLDEVSNNILNGEFDIRPIKIGDDNKSCEFCKFKDICFMEEDDIIKIEKRCKDDTGETD